MRLTIMNRNANPPRDKDMRWWEHPDRPCKNDLRYSDLKLEPSKNARKDMLTACGSCPVYFECLADLMSRPKSDHYGIQAGLQGLT